MSAPNLHQRSVGVIDDMPPALRPFKRIDGRLVLADYKTPQANQQFGYVLEPER